MKKTWKFKHMLMAIVHLKQQKWWRKTIGNWWC